MIKWKLIILFLFGVLLVKGQSADQLLQEQLSEVEGKEKLEIIQNWFQTIERNNPTPWMEALNTLKQTAEEVLPPDERLKWTLPIKLKFAEQLMFMGFRKKSELVLYNVKPNLDNENQLEKELLLEWLISAAKITYQKTENIDSIEVHLQPALTLANELKNDDLNYSLYKTNAWIAIEAGKNQKAVEWLNKAEAIKNKISVSNQEQIELQFYKAVTRKNLNETQGAGEEFQKLLKQLDQVDSTLALQIQIAYGDFLCRSGKSKEAISHLKSLKPQLEKYDIMLYWQKQIYAHADCLTSIGDYEAVKWVYEDYRHRFNDEAIRERNHIISEWEKKLDISKKKSTILSLGEEEELLNAQFRSRMAIGAALLTLGLGAMIFFFVRNRNRKRQLELELEKDRQIAENRDRLFSTITQEIRTPLALMMAPLERAELIATKPQVVNDLKLAQRSGGRLMQLFNQILDWNKAESKALIHNPQPGQLDIVFHEFRDRFEAQANEKGVIFNTSFNIPNETFSIDFDKLDKIVSNLVGNAIKFCEPETEVNLIGKLVDNNKLHIEVVDQGAGIAKEEQEKLFDRHFQGAQGKKKGGTGIGLSLVRDLVDLLKGDIRLESELGVGTSFFVDLPVQRLSIEKESGQFKTDSDGADVLLGNNQPMVLVVEDEPDMLHFLQSALEIKYQVKTANSTKAGLSIALANIPDMIISDWSLPDHDGGWLCRQLKNNELTAHIPVLILTGFSSDQNMNEVLESGAIGRMKKPFKLDILNRQLKAIEKHNLQAQKHWASYAGFSVKEAVPSEKIDPYLQKVKEALEENYQEETYSVEKMASDLLINRTQLFRKIKAISGQSPSDLIRIFRLEKAQILLKAGQKSIADIAFEVGFGSQSYFSTAYKNHFSHSPGKDLAQS